MNVHLVYIFMVLFLGTTAAQSNRDSPQAGKDQSNLCSPDDKCFQIGEKITYVLYYHWGLIWLSAGEVTFEVMEKDGQLYILSVGETYPSYEWFYEVENIYESYLDPETLLPNRTIRSINEGNYYLYEEVDYDRLNGTAISRRTRKKGEELKTFVNEIKPCVQDLLSIMYSARSSGFNSGNEVGTEIPVQLFLDKEQYNLSLTYRGRNSEMKVRKLGTFDLLQFTPDLIKGQLFDEGDEMNIYVSNDNNKLPMIIESPLSVGKVKAILKDYKNLKYPLHSKLD